MSLNEYYRRRIDRLQGALEEAGIEALWVHPSVNLVYLTGIDLLSQERLTGLVIPSHGELRTVVPLLLQDEFAVVEGEHHAWSDAEGPGEATAKALQDISKLHVLGSLPTEVCEELRKGGLGSVEIDRVVLSGLREIKDKREAELLTQSAKVTDEILTWVSKLNLQGLTERGLSGRIQARYLELGLTGVDLLVATGANASIPHYTGGDIPIDPNQPLLLDFGGLVDHYFSDMTRVFFPEPADSEVIEVYEVVCAAYDAALAMVEKGVPCEEIDYAAREVIARAGYGDFFLHRTGHGLGLEVHEPPYLRTGNKQCLEIGHVFSIEPAVYVQGRFGLRYENIIYLGSDGPVELNLTPRYHCIPTQKGF